VAEINSRITLNLVDRVETRDPLVIVGWLVCFSRPEMIESEESDLEYASVAEFNSESISDTETESDLEQDASKLTEQKLHDSSDLDKDTTKSQILETKSGVDGSKFETSSGVGGRSQGSAIHRKGPMPASTIRKLPESIDGVEKESSDESLLAPRVVPVSEWAESQSRDEVMASAVNRKTMVDEIVEVLRFSRKPASGSADNWNAEKYRQLSEQLDQVLLAKASTQDEYTDRATLKVRLAQAFAEIQVKGSTVAQPPRPANDMQSRPQEASSLAPLQGQPSKVKAARGRPIGTRKAIRNGPISHSTSASALVVERRRTGQTVVYPFSAVYESVRTTGFKEAQRIIISTAWEVLSAIDAKSFFAQPVSDKVAPGYSKLISEPMDLRRLLEMCNIQENEQGQEMTLSRFGQFVELICSNCFKYNVDASVSTVVREIVAYAKLLQDTWRYMHPILATILNKTFNPSLPLPDPPRLRLEVPPQHKLLEELGLPGQRFKQQSKKRARVEESDKRRWRQIDELEDYESNDSTLDGSATASPRNTNMRHFNVDPSELPVMQSINSLFQHFGPITREVNPDLVAARIAWAENDLSAIMKWDENDLLTKVVKKYNEAQSKIMAHPNDVLASRDALHTYKEQLKQALRVEVEPEVCLTLDRLEDTARKKIAASQLHRLIQKSGLELDGDMKLILIQAIKSATNGDKLRQLKTFGDVLIQLCNQMEIQDTPQFLSLLRC